MNLTNELNKFEQFEQIEQLTNELNSLTHQLDIIYVRNIQVPKNYDIMLPSQNLSRFQVDC